MTQSIDFTHEDEDGAGITVSPSILGTDNVIIEVDDDAETVAVRVSGPALRDALLEAYPLPVPEDADPDEGKAELVAILSAAEEYAAPRAAHAYATAFSAFVASLHPIEG